MRVLDLVRRRSGRAPIQTLARDEFWIGILADICRTLNSVRQHGGFEHLCGPWRASTKAKCLSEVKELIGILNEWKVELEHELLIEHLPVVSGRSIPEAAS